MYYKLILQEKYLHYCIKRDASVLFPPLRMWAIHTKGYQQINKAFIDLDFNV